MSRRRSAVAEREAFLLERQLHLYASDMYSYAPMSRAAVLGLEDGSVWWGEAFGDASSASGEVVFNTAMTGYQEVASDPSYNGQLVVMTYPLIGNYGVFERAAESRKPWVEALVVRELNSTCREGTDDLDSYLRANGVPGIAGVDTRALTRRLRSAGTLRGALIQVPPHRALDPDIGNEAVAKARATTALALRPLVAEASVSSERTIGAGPKIALLDTGVKENQVRSLVQRGATVRVYPVESSMRELLSWSPDGIVITNGPGDPAAIPHVASSVKILLDMAVGRGSGRPVPILGICLGHQLLGLALGADTYKLKFGHRGANHPVKDLSSGKVEITSQNHGFAVDPDSLPSNTTVTHLNLYDGTVEGFRHVDKPIFSVQYHPEASPGPHDADYLFRQFLETMEQR